MEFSAQFASKQAAPPKSKPQAAPSESFACPFCDFRLFANDEGLWEHVQSDHATELIASGSHYQGGEGFSRVSLRKDALRKGYSSPLSKL
jgi:hypothetical protein